MLQATNNFVLIMRDSIEKEKDGIFIPGQGREKPSRGKVFSVGELVEDKKIQIDKTAIFHKGIGFELDIDGVVYLTLSGNEVIAVL